MSSLLNPVGPKSSRTYWIRRAIVLLALLLVVTLVVLGIRALRGAGGSPAPTPRPATSTSTTAPAATTVTTSAPGVAVAAACNPADISLAATTDRAAYPLSSSAQLGMTIESRAAANCSFDVGSAALELVVMSGNTRVWSSDDCQAAAENRQAVVRPGATGQLTSKVSWDLTRSTPGCATATPTARVKITPGTYQLLARAGELRSAPQTFTVTAR